MRVQGQTVASGHPHPRIGYLQGSELRWMDLSGAFVERQAFNETGLAEIIAENVGSSLFFVKDLAPVIEGAEAIFLCLPTPPKPNGSSDLSFYFKALKELATLLVTRKDQRRVLLISG